MFQPKFYVLSLPRSRTYWMSQFLGCEHDAYKTWPDYGRFISSNSPGDSTSCYMHIKEYINRWSPVIVIHRPIEEVVISLCNIGIEPDSAMLERLTQLDYELDRIGGFHVDYDNINGKLGDIWQHCYANLPYDHERAVEMIDINLQNDAQIEKAREIYNHVR